MPCAEIKTIDTITRSTHLSSEEQKEHGWRFRLALYSLVYSDLDTDSRALSSVCQSWWVQRLWTTGTASEPE